MCFVQFEKSKKSTITKSLARLARLGIITSFTQLSLTFMYFFSARIADVDISQTALALGSPSNLIVSFNKALIAVSFH